VFHPERVSALVMCNTHMGVALPPDLAAMREAHQAKVAELDALAAAEAASRPNQGGRDELGHRRRRSSRFHAALYTLQVF
jgi:hypothetical protein